MDENTRPGLRARIAAWPIWARVLLGVAVTIVVVNLVVAAVWVTVSVTAGAKVHNQFDNINKQLDK